MYDIKEFSFSGAIGVGFFGNEATNKGLNQFVSSADEMKDTIGQLKGEVSF